MTALPESPWSSAPVSLSLAAGDSMEAIRQTVDLWKGGALPEEDLPAILQGILTREALRSTALPQGIALPHTRSLILGEPLLAIGRLAAPVDFAGTPVWLVIAMVSPAGEPAKHLGLLSRLSRFLSSPDVPAALRNAASPEELRALPFPV